MSGIKTKGSIQPPSGSVGLRVAGPHVAMQPGRKIAYKADGTSEGSVKFECALEHVGELPDIGSPHPDDFSLVCHHIEATFGTLNKVQEECFYHGIRVTYGGLSRPTIDYAGGTDMVPIQTHPDFKEFAGTPAAPLHGARWLTPGTDEVTTNNSNAEFAGFFDPTDIEFFGVEYYFVNRPLVSRTIWTNSTPSLKKGMTIVTKIPGFTNPPGITNWLLLDTPYRQVGKSYQVTEQYKGGPFPGWSKKIYPQST
ncbi:MAG: hypothetical protein H8M99_06575 [Gloeobacteraceae cyanobacterium ES-bin-144]|nr:hypothetical protein [Verrucomicrobiales bacterium]